MYKKITIVLIPFIMIAFWVNSNASIVKKETLKLKCSEMSCAGCKKKITEAINALDGIVKLKIDLKKKIITVTFDNEKVSKEKIIEKILEAGYESEIIQ